MMKTKICNCSECEVFQTKAMVGNWEQFTGHFRVRVPCDSDLICFELPGRGGRTTLRAARQIHDLWHQGMTAGDVAQATGCDIAG